AMLCCWRYSQGWLQFVDPETGLLPRNLARDAFWNAKDCAADNYPFLTLVTLFTDRRAFEERMPAILEAEQRLCNRVDRLPDDYDFVTKTFRTSEPDLDALIFGASEYVKDGLLPLTEWLGPSPWSERMLGLLDDIWRHGNVHTEVGVLPSASHEVAGDLMQGYSRCYWMTRNAAYKDRAYLLASYFLDHHLPTNAPKLSMDDHGCEVINGLSEAYFIAAHEDPDVHARWREPMHAMLDRILEVARNENGRLYMLIDPVEGKVLNDELTDNWGYDYNAFATVALLDDVDRYREAIEFTLARLPAAKDYPWENDGADGIADSLESGLNLINRFPIPEAMEWADHSAERLLKKQRDTGVIEGWHGDGNGARTMLMYAMWKTRGAYVEPWRADVAVGAALDDEGYTCFEVKADWPWRGRLRFDVPRHAEYFRMPLDYPRLNQFPEWFTARAESTYLTDEGNLSGAALREGLDISITPDKPFRIRLKAAPDAP
ncbi:MAG TPA: hypothetical protein PKL84_15985, partial [Candidatus Hydrogenedentes bacterium]|nr:hypothetical protein [Candidatus Hydrogenedentota bacterium]